MRFRAARAYLLVWPAGEADLLGLERGVEERLIGGGIAPEELCDQYAAQVYRYAVITTGGSSDAEDIAQEALLRALRALGKFDPKRGSMDSWLWRIVVNATRDASRASRRRLALWERLRQKAATDSDRLMERLESADLVRAIGQLKPRERALIGLRFGVGLDFAGVAAAMGMKTQAATVATHRALQHLRAKLEPAD